MQVETAKDEQRYRDLAVRFGCDCKRREACSICKPDRTDDSLLGEDEDDETWEDGLDDDEVRSLGGGGGDLDRDTWPDDDDYDDDGWGD